MVVDTNSCLKVLSEELRGRLQFLHDASQIVLNNITANDNMSFYTCLAWRRGQCQTLTEIFIMVELTENFLYPKDNITLPCYTHETDPSKVFWLYPGGIVNLLPKDSHQILHHDATRHWGMHMLNGSKTTKATTPL